VLSEPLLSSLREISMNADQLPETRAARRFRLFFEERGLAAGKRDALLKMLEARGFATTDAERTSITACADADLLDQWIVRAMTAGSVGEVLSQPVRAPARRVPRKAPPRGR
jgi:hypothetical protein